jgi:peptidyl-prolyl cis-trans isomerase D
MALIGTIRKKLGWLIAVVVGIALLSFILTDWLGPGGGQNVQTREIAEIGDKRVSATSFATKVEERVEEFKAQTQQPTLEEATVDMIREQVWLETVNEYVLGKEYVDIGLAVHPEESYYLTTGPNPHQIVRQLFSNPQTGQFNSQDVIQYFKDWDNDPTGQRKAQWLPYEKTIIRDRLSQKYSNLIEKGLYVTEKEAMLNYEFVNGSAKFNYVVINYDAIPDSSIQVSEDELNDYYDAHRKEYEQDESRDIKYVTFEVLPTAEDSSDIMDWVLGVKADLMAFESDEDIATYINMNSVTPYQNTYYKAGELSPDIDSVMFALDSAEVVGPYIEARAESEYDAYVLARWIENVDRPDSVKVRHILLPPSEAGDSAHIKKADSIMGEINGGADFTMLAAVFSKDDNNASQGGDIGWFAEGTMFRSFNDTCFSSEVGDIKLVVTQAGAHVVEVTDMTEKVSKVKVGLVDHLIKPSKKTFSSVYTVVNRFAGNSRTPESLVANANEEGLVVRESTELSKADKQITGLRSPRELIRWVYQADKGTVSSIMEFGNKYIVAAVTSVKEEGYATLDDIRTEMEVGAMNKKKAEFITAKLKANDDQNLDDLAANLSANNIEFDLEVASVGRVSFADFSVTGLGREPKLIGTIYGSKLDVLSGPVEGESGVFIFALESVTPAPENQDFSAIKSRLNTDLAKRSEYEVLNALKKATEIVDNRHLFN